MASLTLSAPTIKRHLIIKSQLFRSGSHKLPIPSYGPKFINHRLQTLPLLCTKLFPFKASPLYDENSIIKHGNIVDPIDAEDAPQLSSTQNEEAIFEMKSQSQPISTQVPSAFEASPLYDENSIIKHGNIVDPIDAEDAPQLSSTQNEEAIFEMKSQSQPISQYQPLKWPMWLLGPLVLLATGMVPTLWLPLSSVFVSPNIAGLLSLVGLDCIFNMGATLFFLMADSCAQPKGRKRLIGNISQVPLTYRIWNLAVSVVGLVVPLLMLLASHKGYFGMKLPFISFAVLFGPYLLLLSTQVLTETLTWHWKSPVWLLIPIVYEGYRVLQLMRGVQLGLEIGAPGWVVESIRGLVSWWVLVLGIQLMRVAWFAGLDLRNKHHGSHVL